MFLLLVLKIDSDLEILTLGVFIISCFFINSLSQFWGRIQNVRVLNSVIGVEIFNKPRITHKNRIKDRQNKKYEKTEHIIHTCFNIRSTNG